MRRIVAILVMLATFAGLWAYHRQRAASLPTVHALQGYTMGSTWQVNLVGPGDFDPTATRAAIEAELLRLDNELSGYRPDAELSRLNAAPVGQWRELPQHLTAVLRFGQRLHADSGGAFDLSVKPLVNLWGFGVAEPRTTLPSAIEIASAKARLGSRALEFDAGSNRARRTTDASFDVDAIAPGYVADHISDLLRGRGVSAHMVDIGGELRVVGSRPDGTRWRIGIEAPEQARGNLARIAHVSDAGVATSGDYRDFVTIGGRRYSHTIDPVSGSPVEHALASVTVVAKTAVEADGYATVLMVLGPERGFAFANTRELAVHMLIRDGRGSYVERYNPAFASYLAISPAAEPDAP